VPTSSVVSVDGTSTAVRITGRGSPVVLLHGICADATSWLPIAGLLKDHHTVYSVDRRGRGLSGDGVRHSLDLEMADLLTVLSIFGTPVPALAHSYGATIAVLAAARTDLISDLIAYEPLLVPITATLKAVADQLESCVQHGDRDFAVVHLLEQFEVPGLVERLRAIPPAWEPLVHNVHTVGREAPLADRNRSDAGRSRDGEDPCSTPGREVVGPRIRGECAGRPPTTPAWRAGNPQRPQPLRHTGRTRPHRQRGPEVEREEHWRPPVIHATKTDHVDFSIVTAASWRWEHGVRRCRAVRRASNQTRDTLDEHRPLYVAYWVLHDKQPESPQTVRRGGKRRRRTLGNARATQSLPQRAIAMGAS
jgi:pimeloyl-ACP methyl ester carboxylesterase